MTTITLQHYANDLLTNAIQVKLRDPTGTYGVRYADSGVIAIPPTAAIDPISQGLYEYDVSAPAGSSYVAAWEIYYPSLLTTPQYIYTAFAIDEEVALIDGVRLMDIEWEIATRIGPHKKLVIDNTLGTIQTLVAADFKSTMDIRDYTDLFLLRRGVKDNPGNPSDNYVLDFDSDDRVRRIKGITPSLGSITVDRDYNNPVDQWEVVEIMYLNPDKIRESVLYGLRRAKTPDTIVLSTSSASRERNLTSSAPWLTRQSQVQNLEIGQVSLYTMMHRPRDIKYVNKQGDLYVRLSPDPFPHSIEVTALRPAYTLVNGTTSLVGPNDDFDILAVPLDYAAAAGHIELWRRNKADLQAAAQINYQISQKDAAAEFTKLSQLYTVNFPQKITPADRFGMRGFQSIVTNAS